jgi:pimeloyl-ACP methyl ester carboxylesterase
MSTTKAGNRTIDGLSIRFAKSDEAHDDKVLLTSPWPESLMAYRLVWPALSEKAQLFAVDLPGFGHSERLNELLSPSKMGEFLIRMLDEFGLENPHLVCPDVGTGASLFAAARNPGRIRSLIVGSGGSAYPLQVTGALKAMIDAPDMESFRALDSREGDSGGVTAYESSTTHRTAPRHRRRSRRPR